MSNHVKNEPDEIAQSLEAQVATRIVNMTIGVRAMLWDECLKANISPIQGQILIFCLNYPPELCRIGYLAREFALSKPTISDAVKSLERKNFILKENDLQDQRSFNLILTPQGREIAAQVSGFASPLVELLKGIADTRKIQLDQTLTNIIVELKELGILSGQRSCVDCFYSKNNPQKKGYYCSYFQTKMKGSQIKINCSSFISANA